MEDSSGRGTAKREPSFPFISNPMVHKKFNFGKWENIYY